MGEAQEGGRRRLAILTSGGDAPGMNAAIRAATLVLLAKGHEVYGVHQGYRGLMRGDFRPLRRDQVAHVLREGGTLLGSARSEAFRTPEGRDQARAKLREAGIDGLLVIGGNGSLTGALALVAPEELGDQALQVVGVPASIDNDIGFTGMAIGVDTALNTIVEACDRIADTASAHSRTFIIEVMGRDCGYLAMTSGISVGADAVLFPEGNKDADAAVENIVKAVERAQTRDVSRQRVLVIKAEGFALSVDALKARIDARLRATMPEADVSVETRVTVLGHVVRGGRPSAFDRLLGSRLARVAAEALMAGVTSKMVAWVQANDLPPEVAMRAVSDPYCWLVDLDAALAETKRLLDGTSPLVRWRARAFEQIEDMLSL